MNVTYDVCTSLEEFTDVLYSISEQHVNDFEQARQNNSGLGHFLLNISMNKNLMLML